MRILIGLLGIIVGIVLIIFTKNILSFFSRIGSGMSLEADEVEKMSTPRIIGGFLIAVSILILIGNPQVLAGLAGVGIGVFLVIKSRSIKNFFGNVAWAEEHIGQGGTDSLWKLIGVAIIILSFLWMAGNTQKIFWGVMGQFFGVE